MSYHVHKENRALVSVAFLKPRDMLEHILCTYPWALLGGLQPGPNAESMLNTFWKTYRLEHGSHAVYQMADANQVRLDRTIPLVLHGDGARTQKKQPLEVVSVCPVLGLDTEQSCLTCTCEKAQTYSGKRKRSPLAQRLNLKNSSYATHFLAFAIPSKKYKATPGLLKSLLGEVSENLGEVCKTGLEYQEGYRFHFAVIGMKGDLEYHAKCGLLTRSYMNVGQVNQIPCCSECLAGGAGYPFEDFKTTASWRGTVNQLPPWVEPPPFKTLPFEDWTTGEASRFFKRDPFHIFRLGIGRNFLGSSVVLLCLDGFFDEGATTYGLDQRLSRAWSHFALWCETNKVSPAGIRSFSKQKLHIPTAGSFAWVACKASDTILLLRWMKFFTRLQLVSHPTCTTLMAIAGGCEAGLDFQCIYRHGIWLTTPCRKRVMASASRFICAYAKLAYMTYQRDLQLYAMVPKIHSFDHIKADLEPEPGREFYLNPATWCCSMSEDFVGRVARQSRRISYIKIVENTLLAYKIKCRFQLQRLKKIRKL